jgi:hypothetical protein
MITELRDSIRGGGGGAAEGVVQEQAAQVDRVLGLWEVNEEVVRLV